MRKYLNIKKRGLIINFDDVTCKSPVIKDVTHYSDNKIMSIISNLGISEEDWEIKTDDILYTTKIKEDGFKSIENLLKIKTYIYEDN